MKINHIIVEGCRMNTPFLMKKLKKYKKSEMEPESIRQFHEFSKNSKKINHINEGITLSRVMLHVASIVLYMAFIAPLMFALADQIEASIITNLIKSVTVMIPLTISAMLLYAFLRFYKEISISEYDNLKLICSRNGTINEILTYISNVQKKITYGAYLDLRYYYEYLEFSYRYQKKIKSK